MRPTKKSREPLETFGRCTVDVARLITPGKNVMVTGNFYRNATTRRLWTLAALLLVTSVVLRCGRGRPKFTATQLSAIEAAAKSPHATSQGITIAPTYEQAPPFSATIQPPSKCAADASRALVYVAADPRDASVVLFVNLSGAIVCWDRPHILDIRSER